MTIRSMLNTAYELSKIDLSSITITTIELKCVIAVFDFIISKNLFNMIQIESIEKNIKGIVPNIPEDDIEYIIPFEAV